MKTNKICLYSMLGALTFSLKFAMAALPNIEPVSLLLVVYAVVLGVDAIYPLITYISLEILIYGFGFWSLGYFYMWPTLVAVTITLFKISNNYNPWIWALISGLYGLFFGALYIPLYIISGGPIFAFSWWISGIPHDIIHGISNFILCLTLFEPLTNTLLKLKKYYL